MTEAGRQLKLNTTVVLWRLKSQNPKFNNYKYFNDNIEETCEITENQKDIIISNGIKIIINGIIYN